MVKPHFYILLFISICIPHSKVVGQKTDTIYHINGNILTGELKKLTYGVVTWKMDGMGTIDLEEIKINTMLSNKMFEIKMKGEIIYYGSFVPSNDYRKVFIIFTNSKGEPEKKLVRIEDIVEFYTIKNNFWARTSGDFSLGFNYSKGSDVGSVAFAGNLDYRNKKNYAYFSWSGNNTFQGDSISSTNTTVSLGFQRLINNGWSYQSAISGTQNSELGTKLRWELDLTGIKDIVYNSWNRFYGGTGVSLLREIPYGNDPIAQDDVAGLFQLVWKVYKITEPKIWVDANVSYLPYLTEKRYRTNFNLNPKVSIFSNNFKVGFALYYNFDSDPSEDAVSTNDYGINLNLSYSLH